MKVNQKQKQIPKDWRELKLGDVGITYAGLTGKDKTDFGIGKPFVNYMDVYGSGAMRKLPTSLVRVGEDERQNVVQYGDVVFTTSSETADEVGTASVFLAKSNNPVYLNSFCFGFRINHDFLSPGYAQFFFRSKPFRREMTRIAQGATRYNLSKSHFLQTDIALPSLPEQKRIVKVLEVWDRAVEVLRRKIELKKEIKKGLMQELLIGKTRLPGFSGEWGTKKFGEFFSNRDERGTEDLPLLSITSSRGVIHQSASNKKDTSNSDKSRYLRICPGDIGYNTMRMWQGRSALSNMEGLVSPAYTILSPKKNVDSRYFAYLFKMPRIVYLFFQKSQGLVSDTLQCRYRDYSIVKYPVPEHKEQKAIADVLTAADADITLLEKRLCLLEDQKKYLLNNLITGAIRTPESI